MTHEDKFGIFIFGGWYSPGAYHYGDLSDPSNESRYARRYPARQLSRTHFITQNFQPYAQYQWKSDPDGFAVSVGVKANKEGLVLNQYQDGEDGRVPRRHLGQRSSHRRADLYWRRGVYYPQLRLEQLAAYRDGPLPG